MKQYVYVSREIINGRVRYTIRPLFEFRVEHFLEISATRYAQMREKNQIAEGLRLKRESKPTKPYVF